MTWKRIVFSGKKRKKDTPDPNQPDLFSDPEEQQEQETPSPRKPSRSDLYILQPYDAKGESNCTAAPGSCHKDRRVEVGDEMIRAIPMRGVPGSHFFFHSGPCADANIRKIDEDASKAMMKGQIRR